MISARATTLTEALAAASEPIAVAMAIADSVIAKCCGDGQYMAEC